MRIPQLITSAVVLATAAGLAACNRTEADAQRQHAAAEVKKVAARAGDELADGWLTTRIQAQYFADNQVKARYLDVSTNNGVVTIKGFVDSPASRERALQIARSTDGVKQVNDQLLIGQSPAAFETAQRPVATAGQAPRATTDTQAVVDSAAAALADARVTSSIQSKYFLDGEVKGRRIDVDTRGGVVTLKGEVSSEAERAQALLLARSTEGVERVEDNLTVNAALAR